MSDRNALLREGDRITLGYPGSPQATVLAVTATLPRSTRQHATIQIQRDGSAHRAWVSSDFLRANAVAVSRGRRVLVERGRIRRRPIRDFCDALDATYAHVGHAEGR